MLCELWIACRFLRARHKERIISLIAFISVLGVAVGVAVLIVVISVMSGFDKYLEDKMVGTHAHISVESYVPLDNHQDLMQQLKEIPEVVSISPFVLGPALIRERGILMNVQMRGVIPEQEATVTKIKEYVKEGDLELEDDEIIIGRELAQRLFVTLGDSLSLICAQTIRPSQFKIKGIFDSGMYAYDSGLIISSLKGAQDFFAYPAAVWGVSVKIDNIYRAEQVKNTIKKALGGRQYEVRTWIDLNRNFLEALKLEKLVMFIVVTMTMIVAAFGIANTLIMSVMEKTKDIGIIRSTGGKVNSVLQIFLFQGIGIGSLGILFGLAGGLSLAVSLNKIIDFISRLIGRSLIPKDIYYFDRLPVYFSPKDIIIIVISAFIISLLASIYPAYHASKLKPTEALRYG